MATGCVEAEDATVADTMVIRTGKDERNRLIYERSTFDGWSYRRIAEEFDVSKTQCWQIVQDTGKALISEFSEDIRQMRVHHTLQLKSMIGELREAWTNSLVPLRIEKTGCRSGDEYAETTVKHTGPDPRYIDSAARLLADIRSIWGVDAPNASTVEITGQGVPLVEITVSNREEAVKFTSLVEAKATLIEADSEPNSIASESMPSEPVPSSQ